MRLFIVISFIFLFTGCSNLDNRPEPPVKQRPAPPVAQRPAPAPIRKPVLPKIPEIKAPVVIRPHRYKRGAVVKRRTIVRPKYKAKPKLKPKPKPKPRYKAPVVSRYPRSATDSTVEEIEPEQIAPVEKATPEDTGGDIDPYANIPENADGKGGGRSASSPAVEALLVRAYADAKLGRISAAAIKLERGLRIEPQNPKLWNQLAELHYKKGNYQQAITMAKKAISLSANNEEMTGKNWKLISRVAEKSGDNKALSEANEYDKRH